MVFARGATLTTAVTLGYGDMSNLGPTAGNGFRTRWPDDLAVLQQVGVTDLRLTFDWARLQAKPGDLDSAWTDWYDQVLTAADAIGLRVWATLHDSDEPRWVTNEGGIDDSDVAVKWLPRFVERVADRFGTGVHGWIPFAEITADLPAAGWAATWSALRGGKAPVVASLSASTIDSAASFLETCDLIGIVLAHADLDEREPNDEQLDHLREQMHEEVMRSAELAEDTPMIISQFTARHDAADVQGLIAEQFVIALDAAIADGVHIGIAFVDPAIAGPESSGGLLDSARSTTPVADAVLGDTNVDAD
ncbi:family 1 glycosylhydrolase [Ilumatobacter sp.]|uniref:family 1 glycosylhydrolase n=1 Tax=Ilumatobacter sp. TaxID=1967498 RepID=UPI00375297AD